MWSSLCLLLFLLIHTSWLPLDYTLLIFHRGLPCDVSIWNYISDSPLLRPLQGLRQSYFWLCTSLMTNRKKRHLHSMTSDLGQEERPCFMGHFWSMSKGRVYVCVTLMTSSHCNGFLCMFVWIMFYILKPQQATYPHVSCCTTSHSLSWCFALVCLCHISPAGLLDSGRQSISFYSWSHS